MDDYVKDKLKLLEVWYKEIKESIETRNADIEIQNHSGFNHLYSERIDNGTSTSVCIIEINGGAKYTGLISGVVKIGDINK